MALIDTLKGKKIGVSLASGFFGFYHQTGFLAALQEKGLVPAALTGTSAGAITASLYAAGLEPIEIRDALLTLKRESFWDARWPFTKAGFGLLAGEKFKAELGRFLPVHSFEACRVPLAVGVFNLDYGRVEHLKKGSLIEAVYASGAYPYLFAPAELNNHLYWDGGFGEKCPLVPFLEMPEIEVVLVSYMERREPSEEKRSGLRAFIPPISSFLANTPYEERIERDRASVEVLRQAGKTVHVFCPERVRLGPFSMQKGREAYEQGRAGTLNILESDDLSLLGCPRLS